MHKENLFNMSMLLVRLLVGGIFASHGAQKLFGMFNGIGLEGTSRMVEGLGFPNPYLTAGIWGGIEFVGGIFLILGILVRFSSSLLVLTVLVMLWKTTLAHGFFVFEGGLEHHILVIAACIPLMFLGGGTWSVWDA